MTNQQYQSLLQIMELIDGIESLVTIVISDTHTRHFRHAHTSFQTQSNIITPYVAMVLDGKKMA